jgi:hypothetical protein
MSQNSLQYVSETNDAQKAKCNLCIISTSSNFWKYKSIDGKSMHLLQPTEKSISYCIVISYIGKYQTIMIYKKQYLTITEEFQIIKKLVDHVLQIIQKHGNISTSIQFEGLQEKLEVIFIY